MADERLDALADFDWQPSSVARQYLSERHPGHHIDLTDGPRGWLHFARVEDEASGAQVEVLVAHSRYGTLLTAHLEAFENPPAPEA